MDIEETIKWEPSLLLEVKLSEPDDFLKVKETLTRIGIESKKEINTLYQSCHILHKKGKYFITHFKELFSLDGKATNLCEEDLKRRNTITKLLADWNLLTIVPNDSLQYGYANLKNIKIIPYKNKKAWILKSKYTVGK